MKNSFKFWDIDSFEVSTFKYSINERFGKTYNKSGSENSGKCTYTYNEFGFRGDEIDKDGFKVMSIGCSITEGVAVNDDETWPHLISKKFKDGVNINLGFGGRSNDYISRALLTYYDFFQPNLVLIMYTDPYRCEYYTEDGGIEPWHPKPWGWFEKNFEESNALTLLTNKNQAEYNWYKNHLLITNYLKNKKTPFIWNGWFTKIDYTDENRFDGDYFPFVDFGVDGYHPGYKTNKKYTDTLFEHLKNKCLI